MGFDAQTQLHANKSKRRRIANKVEFVSYDKLILQ